jgi:hypothetical protein
MPDPINTKDHETPLPPRECHEAGVFIAQCVDVIDLGKKPDVYQGDDKGLVPKMALVFVTGERSADGALLQVSAELTISSGPKATLRKWAEAWRGQPYPKDQPYPNIPVDKFCGLWASITVINQESAKGNTYAKITQVTGLPKGYKPPASLIEEYETAGRGDWWAKRKEEYAKEAAAYLAKHQTAPSKKAAPPPPPSADDFAPSDDDSELPF